MLGKHFYLKKILNNQPNRYLTSYIDLSKTYGGQKGILTEEEVIKQILDNINTTINENEFIYSNVKDTIHNRIKKLKLKD